MTYYTSDSHWFHDNIRRYCGRPFTSVDAMNAHLIDQWNRTITDKETDVWHLGDFAFAKAEQIREVFDQLNGTKHLILGNHDRLSPRKYVEEIGFASCHQSYQLRVGRYNLMLQHRPPSVLDPWPKGIHAILCGHIHDRAGWWESKNPRPRIYNISVEKTDYRPVTFEEIVEINSAAGRK